MNKHLYVLNVRWSQGPGVCHFGATHKLEALGTVYTLPVGLVPPLGVGTRELLPAYLTFVHWWVIRMRGLEMAVAIVAAGKISPALIALEANWRRGRNILDRRPRGGRERRRVGALENSRFDQRGRGDVLNLIGPNVAVPLRLWWRLVGRLRHRGREVVRLLVT